MISASGNEAGRRRFSGRRVGLRYRAPVQVGGGPEPAAGDLGQQRAAEDGDRDADDQAVHDRQAGARVVRGDGEGGGGVRGQQPVRDVQPGRHGQPDVQQVGLGALGDRVHQRYEHDEADVEQVRHPDQQGRRGDRCGDPLDGAGADEGGGDAVGTAGTEKDAAQDRAEPDGGAGALERVAEAVLEVPDRVGGADAGRQPEAERGEHQGDEGVQLRLGDQQDEDDDGGRAEEEVLQVRAHGSVTVVVSVSVSVSVSVCVDRVARPSVQAVRSSVSGFARSAMPISSPARTSLARVVWAAR
ncbi:hypothetical protein GA0115246_112645 [Streptomyces sp. SolWspMP-sol7th]|nr:hypothetical protein GA0115246_112645 [Streptomyces sp. SolWspMP-sol7th]